MQQRSWWGRVWDWLTGPWGTWHRVFRAVGVRPQDLAAILWRRHPRYPWMLCCDAHGRYVDRDGDPVWLISVTYRRMNRHQRWLDKKATRCTGTPLYPICQIGGEEGVLSNWVECKP